MIYVSCFQSFTKAHLFTVSGDFPKVWHPNEALTNAEQSETLLLTLITRHPNLMSCQMPLPLFLFQTQKNTSIYDHISYFFVFFLRFQGKLSFHHNFFLCFTALFGGGVEMFSSKCCQETILRTAPRGSLWVLPKTLGNRSWSSWRLNFNRIPFIKINRFRYLPTVTGFWQPSTYTNIQYV